VILAVSGCAECGFDAVGERVDELGELGDGLEGAVFAPAGHVWDRLAGDVQAEAAEHDQGGGVDDDFGLGSRVVLVVDSEGVDGLVDERAQPRVGGAVGVDDDLLGLGVAPAAGAAGDRLKRDGVAERLGEGDRRRDQVGVRIAGERLAPACASKQQRDLGLLQRGMATP
jgi:hypothetical protein